METASHSPLFSQQRQQDWNAKLNRVKSSEIERCDCQCLHKDFLERLERVMVSCQTNRLTRRTRQSECAVASSRSRLMRCSPARKIEIVIGAFRYERRRMQSFTNFMKTTAFFQFSVFAKIAYRILRDKLIAAKIQNSEQNR